MNQSKQIARAHKVLEIAREMAAKADKEKGTWSIGNHIDEMNIHMDGYAEPGYDGEVIATGNWNNVDVYNAKTLTRDDVSNLPSRVSAILEKLGVSIEWSDEWVACGDCGKLVRTSPDSYSWTPSYAIVNDCELLCHECIESDPSDYLESLENNPSAAMTLDIDPTDHGYVRMNEHEYENGFFEGQNDSPKKILVELESKGYQRVLFNISEASQFYMKFDVYVHESDIERMEEEKEERARESEEGESV
jgi:hypothetical protein